MEREEAIQLILGGRVVDVVEKCEAMIVVLPVGGALFFRTSGEEGFIDTVPHEVEIGYAYPDGKDGRRVVDRVKVKEIPADG